MKQHNWIPGLRFHKLSMNCFQMKPSPNCGSSKKPFGKYTNGSNTSQQLFARHLYF
eukprot:m.55826 g.55826  ORF g.55826 m.55826 type:complete len:56 (-) comp22137_c0_seq1:154-321(-)